MGRASPPHPGAFTGSADGPLGKIHEGVPVLPPMPEQREQQPPSCRRALMTEPAATLPRLANDAVSSLHAAHASACWCVGTSPARFRASRPKARATGRCTERAAVPGLHMQIGLALQRRPPAGVPSGTSPAAYRPPAPCNCRRPHPHRSAANQFNVRCRPSGARTAIASLIPPASHHKHAGSRS